MNELEKMLNDPNYDGQGKSRQEEDDASVQMLGGVLFWTLLIIASFCVLLYFKG